MKKIDLSTYHPSGGPAFGTIIEAPFMRWVREFKEKQREGAMKKLTDELKEPQPNEQGGYTRDILNMVDNIRLIARQVDLIRKHLYHDEGNDLLDKDPFLTNDEKHELLTLEAKKEKPTLLEAAKKVVEAVDDHYRIPPWSPTLVALKAAVEAEEG